jgi:predicted unusual protein kinase regulating ubiquinone biosynthesis (AarF/ABC1/UbiB family)
MRKARYRRIIFFFGRIILNLVVWDLILPHLGLRKWSNHTRPERMRKTAVKFRHLAIHLGGVMIKVGQFLSARADVLPEEITSELAGLQDEVPPEKFSDIRSVAEEEFGQPLEQKFAFFDEVPLAAASLGQVHRARLWSEEPLGDARKPASTSFIDVVVKIQRPHIEEIIQTDLAALITVGNWLKRYPPIRKRADVPALLAEFSQILYEEIDYVAEGGNAEKFAENFQKMPEVRVPKVVWSHTTRRALTLEDVGGIKITDHDAIIATEIKRDEIATRLINTYFKQIFEDGFFHADPHPGNLFVSSRGRDEDGEVQWLLTFVDFGMVGNISDDTRQGLREMLIGVGTRDQDRIIRSYQLLNVLLPDADIELLKKAGEKAFERFWGKSMIELRDISPAEIHDLMNEFRELLYDMPFQVPHDLIFLARAVSILSGICTGLDSEFNIWSELSPYAQKLITNETVNRRGFWLDEIGLLAQKLLALPQRANTLFERIERGDLVVKDTLVSEQVRRLRGPLQAIVSAVIFAAFLLGGVQLYLGGRTWEAGFFWFASAVALYWSLRRNGNNSR